MASQYPAIQTFAPVNSIVQDGKLANPDYGDLPNCYEAWCNCGQQGV